MNVLVGGTEDLDDWIEDGLETTADMSQHLNFPVLDDEGWHPASGDAADRRKTLQWLKRNHNAQTPDVVAQMKKWYLEDNLFLGSNSPNVWTLTSMKSVSGGGVGTSIVQGLVSLAKPWFTFYPSHYEETVKVLGSSRITKWLICCYLSPTERIIKCIDGFVSKAEKTLRATSFLKDELPRALFVGDFRTQDTMWAQSGTIGMTTRVEAVDQEQDRVLAFELVSPHRGHLLIATALKPYKLLHSSLGATTSVDHAEGTTLLTSSLNQPAKHALSTTTDAGELEALDNNDVVRIPWAKLQIEPKHFARGGGGLVFRGVYMGSTIAAKQVFVDDSKEEFKDFYREAAMLSKLRHPSVVSSYGISEDPNSNLYIIMEYCGGGDLSGYYTDSAFTKREFVRVAEELLSGVQYLHARGIAHRDLKPPNVLLEAGTRRVKLADFGQAKKDRQSSVTRGVGTIEYMPPELYNEDDGADGANVLAIDIYAVAIILWQLWFRRKPFAGFSMLRISTHVAKGARLPFSEPEGGQLRLDRASSSAEDGRAARPEGGQLRLDRASTSPEEATARAALAALAAPTAPPRVPIELQELIAACWDADPVKRPKIGAVVASFAERVRPAVEKSVGGAAGAPAAGVAVGAS